MTSLTESHKSVFVRLPASMRDKLERTAEEHDRSVSAEIRQALAAYLDPERMKRDAA